MNSSIHRFNHKTAAEDVHFTCVSPTSESDTDTDTEKKDADQENDGDDETPDSSSEREYFSGSDLELSSSSGNEPTYMEMIIIKDVKAGAEVRTFFFSCSFFLVCI